MHNKVERIRAGVSSISGIAALGYLITVPISAMRRVRLPLLVWRAHTAARMHVIDNGTATERRSGGFPPGFSRAPMSALTPAIAMRDASRARTRLGPHRTRCGPKHLQPRADSNCRFRLERAAS